MIMETPDKVYIPIVDEEIHYYMTSPNNEFKESIEYTRSDIFIEKAKKWFEAQNEGVDYDGNYICDMSDFNEFINYINKL